MKRIKDKREKRDNKRGNKPCCKHYGAHLLRRTALLTPRTGEAEAEATAFSTEILVEDSLRVLTLAMEGVTLVGATQEEASWEEASEVEATSTPAEALEEVEVNLKNNFTNCISRIRAIPAQLEPTKAALIMTGIVMQTTVIPITTLHGITTTTTDMKQSMWTRSSSTKLNQVLRNCHSGTTQMISKQLLSITKA